MVETNASTLSLGIREVFQNQQDDLVKGEDFTVMISHIGSFSQDLASRLALAAEKLLIDSGDGKKVVKRVFSILTEGLRNVRIHGGKDDFDKQLGYLIVARNSNEYKIIMANIICSSECQRLKDYIDLINSYSQSRVKESYTSTLLNEFLTRESGEGLGFITTRMKSGNPIESSFHVLNEAKMLVAFSVKLDRELT
jgi:hypothetical protein